MPTAASPLVGEAATNYRVVGKDALSPSCHDIIFSVGFLANLVFIGAFFFVWVGNGCQGWPEEDTMDATAHLHGISNETMAAVTGASVLTGTYALLFSILWVILYLGIMKVAAFCLIIGMYLLVVILMAVFAYGFYYYASNCKDTSVYTETCSDDTQVHSYVFAVLGAVFAVLMILWVLCIWKRIEFTAKMLSLVSGVLAICPGTVLIGVLMSIITCVWWVLWGGAFVQGTIYLAGGEHHNVPYGQWIGLLFGFLISGWWGHKVFVNISLMTSCHVIASWYFDPDSATEGVPCCKPVTMVGLKRACTNYLGSIAFGSLIVAILEAVYYTCKYVADQAASKSNFVIQLVICCFLCLLKCIKNCIEWLTEWAYCYIAVYGVSFISAGGKVFKMLAESGMGAVAQSTLVTPVLYLGCLLGGAVGVGSGYLTLQSHPLESDYQWTQPFFGFCIGFLAASAALACVDAGNKAIYVCYVDAPDLMEKRDPNIKGFLEASPDNKMKEYRGNGEPLVKP